MAIDDPSPKPTRPAPPEEPPRAGPILAAWMILVVIIQATSWVSGARMTSVGDAIEIGAARAESRGIGEVGDEVIRKAIGLQHDTRSFWIASAMIGDFVFEPLGLALRAASVATLFAAIALVKGRPVGFSEGLAACAMAQGFWVLGLALRATLAIVLKRPEIETSATLLLNPGSHHAIEWVMMRQIDVFALIGWAAMAHGGWKRGQVGWVGAICVCVGLFLIESMMRVPWSLLMEAGMRLTLMPEVAS